MNTRRSVMVVCLLGLSVPALLPFRGAVRGKSGEPFVARGVARLVPVPPPEAYNFSVLRTAPLDVAKVFGRSPACADAAPELVEQVARAAVLSGVDPKLAAATVAVESGCDPFAVSRRGAVGLMQVMPRVWAGKFDIQGKVNLLNARDNLRVGTEILAGLVQDYGVQDGVRRYQGTGVGCETCDGAYTSKILALAGRRR